jgi:3-hydroxyisobutyrate dehydrogenase-like beta-hydroxyacid dehydrogenase
MKIETVGIFSTGEMGHRVAAVLRKHGLNVVTCLAGRSARTAELAAKAGVSDLATPAEVVVKSDMIISIVVPSAAKSLAETIARAIAAAKKTVLYADANAISPMTATAIEKIITGAGGRFADVCIIGTSANVGQGTTFFASGEWAAEFAELSRFGLQIEILGDRPGQASAYKIVYAGLTKGVSSLMLEMLLLAHSLGILEPMIAQYRKKFPDLVRFAESNLPGLPFRAARRSDEMEELSRTIAAEGLTPVMAPASRRLLASLGELNLRAEYSEAEAAIWDVESIIALLYLRLSESNKRIKSQNKGEDT